ncbi:hypothetical protein HCN44_011304 [Aphidius gifuensis]|uniref:Beta-1,3-glucan-binding protein n=1 Tax=Aphidius gifuensis TaxID=684658 RepID=A0A834XV66_APHGI|nr:beta-1,3-glucan-binding protein 1-like [Aphidius gifuensis]KAF7994035.1 hypothetical protein HCN44_011304 [Aphidius gifuensis]
MKRIIIFSTRHIYLILLLIFLIIINDIYCVYTPPQAKVEPLHPKGIRISIPDEEGISLVAFHVKFNEEFSGIEAGTIARDILRIKKGRWTYEDFTTELKTGDIVYYWIHVVYDGLGYNLLFQEHHVTDFYNRDGSKIIIDDSNIVDGSDCRASATKILDISTGNLKNICAGKYILNDSFEHLNNSIWKINEEFSKRPDYPFSVFRNNKKNVEINRGNLYLKPTIVEQELPNDFVRHGTLTLQNCTSELGTPDCSREARGRYILPPTFSGSVDTSKSVAFLYGNIEIRAKLPRGDWIYPILALEQAEKSLVISPQLRIASSVGNAVLNSPAGADISGHVLSAGPNKMTPGDTGTLDNPQRFGMELWSNEYHTYQLEWRKNRIITRVDDIEYGSFVTGSTFDKPMFLKLAVGVGGLTEFPDMSSTDKYSKPWRNVGSQALFDFYNSTNLWSPSWIEESKDLQIDYVLIKALD